MAEKVNRILLAACQMAYRKHVVDDESVGWNELADVLCAALSETMGDKAFVKWTEKIGVSGKPIVE